VLHLDGSGETQTRRYGHPGVPEVLAELDRLHVRKSAGYGSGSDPFANYRDAARDCGMPEWMPALLRVVEKKQRLRNWRETTVVIEEELKDIALCAVIALVMLRESQHATGTANHGAGKALAAEVCPTGCCGAPPGRDLRFTKGQEQNDSHRAVSER
jgi:hypothetical protein